MSAITPEEARAYFKRFELLREEQARQLARTSMETKLRQLAALMASRHLFDVEADREAGVEEVRERWARLRQALTERVPAQMSPQDGGGSGISRPRSACRTFCRNSMRCWPSKRLKAS